MTVQNQSPTSNRPMMSGQRLQQPWQDLPELTRANLPSWRSSIERNFCRCRRHSRRVKAAAAQMLWLAHGQFLQLRLLSIVSIIIIFQFFASLSFFPEADPSRIYEMGVQNSKSGVKRYLPYMSQRSRHQRRRREWIRMEWEGCPLPSRAGEVS